MRKLLLPCIFVVIALIGRAPSATDAPSHDERTLKGETCLETCLETLGKETFSTLPVPQRSTAPNVDGKLEEEFWKNATMFRWQTVGASEFLNSVAWKIYVALDEKFIYFAGERQGEAGNGNALLSLDGSWRDRLVIRLNKDGGSYARAEAAGATEKVERYGGAFAANGEQWELKMPRDNRVFPPTLGKDRPLVLTYSRGLPGEIFVSPAFHLVPSDVALRAEKITADANRNVTISVKVLNGKDAQAQDHIAAAPLGASVARWKSGDFHYAVPTYFPDPEALKKKSQESLDAASENLKRIGQTQSALSRAIASVRQSLDATNDAAKLEEIYFQSRLLKRKTFFAGLPPDLDEILFVKRYHYRYGQFYTTYLHYMPGGNLCVYSLKKGTLRNLLEMPADACVRDPSLHYDGKRVIFAMRRKDTGANLYEVNVDGTGLRRLTEGTHHDLEPCYLPNGKILFGSTRSDCQNCCNSTDNYNFHTINADGTGLQRVGFNYLVDFTPTVMSDGKVLFQRWVHEDKPGNFINALWTMRPDGSQLDGFFGLNNVGVTIEPQPIPGTNRVVAMDSGSHGHWRCPQVGDIGVLDPNVDRNEYLYMIKAKRGGFKTPYPVGGDVFLASYGWTDTRWAIYLVDRWGNQELVYRDPEIGCYNPIVVKSHPAPPIVPEVKSPTPDAPATVLIQDVYRGLPSVKRGTIKSLRVVAIPDKPKKYMWGFLDQSIPVALINRMVRVDLGTVPVHEDGSVYFQVPPKTNVFFQALDEDGLMVHTMRDNVSFVPGEHRTCVGCHEPRNTPPLNNATLQALKQPPAQITPPKGSKAQSFPRDVQPIFDRHCVKCHDAEKPAGNVILSGDLTPFFNMAYEHLTKGGHNYNNQNWGVKPVKNDFAFVPAIMYVTDAIAPRSTGAYASPLFKLLDKGHYDVKLSKEDRTELARWIDLNLQYYDDWDMGRLGKERRVLSDEAENVIEAVFQSRCRGCHGLPDVTRSGVVSLTRPHLSPILRAPLAKDKGGTERCQKAIFADTNDPDYRRILSALTSDQKRLAAAK